MGVPHFNALAANIRIVFTCPETRMIVLSDAVNRTIVSSFVWTKDRNVTDGQTDRQNRAGYYSSLHCEQWLDPFRLF